MSLVPLSLYNNEVVASGFGLFETLAAGFTVVHRRPFLLLVPALLDLLVWAGPRIGAGPVLESARLALRQFIEENGQQTGAVADSQQVLEMLELRFQELGQVNLLSVAGWQLPGQMAISAERPAAFELTALPLLAVLSALLVVGVVLAVLFYGPLAMSVAQEQFRAPALLKRLPGDFFRISLWLLLVVVVVFALILPVSIVVGLVSLVSQAIGVILILLCWILALLLSWWLAFTPIAIYLSRVNPIQAAFSSIRVVGQNPYLVFTLLMCSYATLVVWPLFWSPLENVPAAMVFAIFGQAYFSTGLAAAMMVYYRDRMLQQRPASPDTSQPAASE